MRQEFYGKEKHETRNLKFETGEKIEEVQVILRSCLGMLHQSQGFCNAVTVGGISFTEMNDHLLLDFFWNFLQ